MSSTTLIRKNGFIPAAEPPSWLQSSVREFFSACNWEDQPPEVQELKLTALQGSTEPLSLTLSVRQFFGAIAWDGNAVAAPPPAESPSSASAPVDEFTLDDFSSLF
jgi:hypothetical protein